MTLSDRLDALAALGNRLAEPSEKLAAVMRATQNRNAWFTIENQQRAISEIQTQFLDREKLMAWVGSYSFSKNTEGYPLIENGVEKKKTVGLVLAGNIPLVGFHDILCVFVAGHKAKIKISEKDPYLLPYLIAELTDCDPRTADFFDITEGFLKNIDAVIATGSNNSARYFEAYFGKYPNIIRKNRNAVAILRGDESSDELHRLGKDVFAYFGLGCRNVSKIYIPRHYDFVPLLTALHEFRDFVLHDKYKNNFDYQFTLLILNKVKHEANGCILMREFTEIASPIAVLFYEYYDTRADLDFQLCARANEIQLIVAKEKVEGLPTFDFGEAQKPRLSDYADGVDTLDFLGKL